MRRRLAAAFRRARPLTVAVSLLIALGTPSARLAHGAPILTFESHVGTRTKEAARSLEQLAAILELHGFAARPASILKIVGGRAPRSGITDRATTLADIAERINVGFNAYISSRFDEAVTELSKALTLIHENPALVVTDTKNESMMLKAFMGLALSQNRLQQRDDSEATMGEIVRTFAGQPISRAEYGADAAEFYRTVAKRLQSAGRGSLTVKTGDERALIFVDEHLRGVGAIAVGDLIPGIYRVLVQVPGTPGRRYEIDVKANEDAYLDIALAIEDRLTVDDAWIGFVFGNEADRANEARYASEVARRWTDPSHVAVIGTVSLKGKPAMIATLYRSNGEVMRAAVVNLTDANDDRLRSLARFMADGTPSQELDILHGDRLAPEQPAGATSQRNLLGPALVVTGVVGLAGSAVLYAFDEDPSPEGGPTYLDTAPWAVGIGAVSAIALGIGIWRWLKGRPDSPTPRVAPRRDGVTVAFELVF